MKEYHVLKTNSIPILPRAPPSIILCVNFDLKKIIGGSKNVNNRKSNQRT